MSTTVTSENLAEFNAANYRGPQQEPEIEQPAIEAKVEDPVKVDDEPKKKSGVSERIAEVIAARKAAETRAENAERERDELRAKQPKPEAVEDPTKPKAADYKDAFEFAEALADWKVDTKLKERDANSAREKVVDGWKARVVEAKAELEDFDDVIATSEAKVHNDARDAIIESDFGPKILYALASDDDLAAKFSALSPRNQVKEIGRMETRFEKIEEKVKDEPKEEIKLADIDPPKRKAPPAPTVPVKGGMAAESLDDSAEFKGTFAQYEAMRRREMAKA